MKCTLAQLAAAGNMGFIERLRHKLSHTAEPPPAGGPPGLSRRRQLPHRDLRNKWARNLPRRRTEPVRRLSITREWLYK